MAGWFELTKAENGKFRFVLKAGNSETILTSEQYDSKGSAEKGIASVQANAAQNEMFERKMAANGKPFFSLKAANHQIIGTSQMYSTEAARDAGITSVMTNGPAAAIKDKTAG